MEGELTPSNKMDGHEFTLGFSSAEDGGYLSICQAVNGVIHLITSRQHYVFNLKWLETRPPAEVHDHLITSRQHYEFNLKWLETRPPAEVQEGK